ncbi:NEP1-interacting protein-like 1 [Eucalyptus grandis]|uniref:NEP1-interacting protein-like 1 n=1 Tax=Eucalyptus grandis TaxID=71139 RepID=UPI00192ED383|nr:NEP1-interacting protein-like 1 [Eucalyptus grandis]
MMMKRWVCGVLKQLQLRFRELAASSLWVGEGAGASRTGRFCIFLKRAFLAAFTCAFALGGAIVGIISGALKGQTTETGFVRGAGIGAVTGAVTAVQLLELMVDGESLSKVALLCSLVDGKVFMEWVGPAVLKAYQWQVSNLETPYREISDIYDTDEDKGLSQNCIQRLPEYHFQSSKMAKISDDGICCSICLQDFKEGETGRRLPKCGHIFHLECLDAWLVRRGSCPMCRDSICDHENPEFVANCY